MSDEILEDLKLIKFGFSVAAEGLVITLDPDEHSAEEASVITNFIEVKINQLDVVRKAASFQEVDKEVLFSTAARAYMAAFYGLRAMRDREPAVYKELMETVDVSLVDAFLETVH